MARYRKKPVVIEAFQLTIDNIDATPSWPNWLHAAWANDVIEIHGQTLDINTLEGTMTGRPGDWIIKGVKGELYPCKPDIFEASYEPQP